MQNAISYQFNKIGIKSIRVVAGDLNLLPNAAFGLNKDLQEHIERVRGRLCKPSNNKMMV